MSEPTSQLPADIEVSAARLKKLVGELRAALQDLRGAAQGHDLMTGPLITARMAQVELGSEVECLQGLIRVGQLPQIALVETRQQVREWAETRISPAQGLTTAELRSLHRANDHTVDPDLEQPERLALEGAR